MDNGNGPKVGVSVLVMKDNKVLLGKRKGSHGHGTWAPPGGHLEKLELAVECGLREVREETGLDVEMVENRPIAVTEDSFFEEGLHYVTLWLRARYVGGILTIREPEKCSEWGWYTWNNLPRKKFVPVRNLIKQGYNPFEENG